jgi:LysW-gamma-L-lysine/LysW-L-ornithine aminotransferase
VTVPGDVLLVKLGGGDVSVDAVAEDLASLGRPFVLLHGANKLRDELAEQLGRPPRVIESISGMTSVFSDDEAIDVLLAAYAGIRNKRIVEALRKRGVNAIGLTGLDGGLVQGEQNRGIRVEQDGRKRLLRDQSGKPRSVNGVLLRSLLADGYAPVLTVPIVGEDGVALNTENDEVLALLAAELGSRDVVSLIEEAGLLEDPALPSSLVREVDADDLEGWEGNVGGRMRRKVRALRNLFDAAGEPGPRFRLADGRVDAPVSRALAGAGTLIARRAVLDVTRGADDGGPRGSVAGVGEAGAGEGGAGEGGVGETGAGETGAGRTEVRGAGTRETEGSVSAGSAAWLERQARHELDVYGKGGVTLVGGSGATVVDADGRRYLDCVGGHGALALGHRHPALEAALTDQASRIWMVPGSFGSPPRTRFLERLHEALPPELDRTFLSNSGTEAVEAALKIARAATGRSDLVAAVRGFHGRTMGALSVTFEPHFRQPFEPLLGPVRRVPFNKTEALADVVDGAVAAVILEPVQGEGGVHIADADFLREARALCDEHGALLVFDEVQTGFGRTGRLFAFEHSGVVPDVLCLAKSVAGGLPLGATVVRRGIDLGLGTHGSTFGGNPIACAVGRATLDVLLDGDLLERAERIGAAICAPLLADMPDVVREVRRLGAMIGVQTKLPARPYVAALQERGVFALTAGRTVLRLLPPLVMTDEEARRVGEALAEALSAPVPGESAINPEGAGRSG